MCNLYSITTQVATIALFRVINRYVGTNAATSLHESLPMPPLNPDVADPLTVYDEEHAITYMRLLDADAEGADWREVARIVLHIDPDREAERARQGLRKPSRPRQVDEQVWLFLGTSIQHEVCVANLISRSRVG